MKVCITVLACVWATATCATASTAEGNLHPENSPWGIGKWSAQNEIVRDDERILSEIEASMPDAFSQGVKVRAIEIGYAGIWVVGLKEAAGGYRIFAFEPKEWTFTTGRSDHATTNSHSRPDSLRNTKVHHCELAIDRTTGDRIVQTWKGMLLKTAYTGSLTADPGGGVAHYAMTLNGRPIVGQAWSSETGRTRKLGQIVLTMNEFCQKKTDTVRSKLDDELTDILRSLR